MFNTDTPIGEGLKRAIVNAFITFVYVTILTYQGLLRLTPIPESNDMIRDAVIAGALAALAPFIVQTAQAQMDQSRANNGVVNASDVPIAIAAKKANRKPSAVARDYAPEKLAA